MPPFHLYISSLELVHNQNMKMIIINIIIIILSSEIKPPFHNPYVLCALLSNTKTLNPYANKLPMCIIPHACRYCLLAVFTRGIVLLLFVLYITKISSSLTHKPAHICIKHLAMITFSMSKENDLKP